MVDDEPTIDVKPTKIQERIESLVTNGLGFNPVYYFSYFNCRTEKRLNCRLAILDWKTGNYDYPEFLSDVKEILGDLRISELEHFLKSCAKPSTQNPDTNYFKRKCLDVDKPVSDFNYLTNYFNRFCPFEKNPKDRECS